MDPGNSHLRLHRSHIFIIDVSQSVEHDHPQAFDFLRKDIRNVEAYFARRSLGEVATLGILRTWDFIVKDELTESSTKEDMSEGCLLKILADWQSSIPPSQNDVPAGDSRQHERELTEAVFLSSHIHRNLQDIRDPERAMALGVADESVLAMLSAPNSTLVRKDQAIVVTADSSRQITLDRSRKHSVHLTQTMTVKIQPSSDTHGASDTKIKRQRKYVYVWVFRFRPDSRRRERRRLRRSKGNAGKQKCPRLRSRSWSRRQRANANTFGTWKYNDTVAYCSASARF
jgi:hypothetical protein